VFHAGDGNLHPLILFDGREPKNFEKAEILAGKILRMCIELGGSITGEHGIGVEKLKYVPAMFSDVDISVMQAIRSEIDPLEISNQGKMLPPKVS
jgi:glycolate oxidase